MSNQGENGQSAEAYPSEERLAQMINTFIVGANMKEGDAVVNLRSIPGDKNIKTYNDLLTAIHTALTSGYVGSCSVRQQDGDRSIKFVAHERRAGGRDVVYKESAIVFNQVGDTLVSMQLGSEVDDKDFNEVSVTTADFEPGMPRDMKNIDN